jgi:hypothetical protein
MTPLQIILLLLGFALLFLATALVRNFRNRRAAAEASKAGMPATDLATGRELAVGAMPSWLKITPIDLVYGLAMLVGILAKEIWDSINETSRLSIRWGRLVAALIVSPIVYAAVYTRFTQGQVDLLGLAIAFQNGFFWQAVFRTAQESSEGANPNP